MSEHGQDWMGDSTGTLRRKIIIASAFFSVIGIYLAVTIARLYIEVLRYDQEKQVVSFVTDKTEHYYEGNFSTYNAESGQTDNDPLTMASGNKVYEGAVANNCLKFGTKIEVEGVGTFIVEDRMNKRYNCDKFDIFRWNKRGNITGKFRYQIVDKAE